MRREEGCKVGRLLGVEDDRRLCGHWACEWIRQGVAKLKSKAILTQTQ